MKIFKRTILAILMLTIIGFLFRGWLYRYLVTYQSVGVRTNYIVTNDTLTGYIEASLTQQTDLEVEQIIQLGLSITARRLHFTAAQNDIDPNKLVSSKAAHCVGYAAFFATTCNYLLKKYNLADRWNARPQIGQLYFLGTNMHQYSNSPFFKDHDFVTIENKTTGAILAVDPTVNDYLDIDLINYTNEQYGKLLMSKSLTE